MDFLGGQERQKRYAFFSFDLLVLNIFLWISLLRAMYSIIRQMAVPDVTSKLLFMCSPIHLFYIFLVIGKLEYSEEIQTQGKHANSPARRSYPEPSFKVTNNTVFYSEWLCYDLTQEQKAVNLNQSRDVNKNYVEKHSDSTDLHQAPSFPWSFIQALIQITHKI